MKHLNRFQNIVVRVCRIKLFNVNEALRQQWRNGKAAGIEEGRKEKPDCIVCPLYKADQILLHTPPPPPTTEGEIAVQHIPNPRGHYFQKRRKEFTSTKLMPIAERPDGFLL